MMPEMAPEINWGFSASMKVEDLERRVKTLEVEIIRRLDLIEKLLRHDPSTWAFGPGQAAP